MTHNAPSRSDRADHEGHPPPRSKSATAIWRKTHHRSDRHVNVGLVRAHVGRYLPRRRDGVRSVGASAVVSRENAVQPKPDATSLRGILNCLRVRACHRAAGVRAACTSRSMRLVARGALTEERLTLAAGGGIGTPTEVAAASPDRLDVVRSLIGS